MVCILTTRQPEHLSRPFFSPAHDGYLKIEVAASPADIEGHRSVTTGAGVHGI